jgi:hypothetical protein
VLRLAALLGPVRPEVLLSAEGVAQTGVPSGGFKTIQ